MSRSLVIRKKKQKTETNVSVSHDACEYITTALELAQTWTGCFALWRCSPRPKSRPTDLSALTQRHLVLLSNAPLPRKYGYAACLKNSEYSWRYKRCTRRGVCWNCDSLSQCHYTPHRQRKRRSTRPWAHGVCGTGTRIRHWTRDKRLTAFGVMRV